MPVIGCLQLLLILTVLFANAFCESNDIDVRLIDDSIHKYCVAAGRDLQSIMMWDNNPTESYFEPNLENLRINCKFKVNEECTQYWRGHDWVVKNSLELLLGPLLDRRWEGVPSYAGREYSGRIDFTNKHYFSIQNGNNFEIPVSFKSDRDLHMFLCDGKSELESNCYWIIIASWGGTETGIRKCKSKQIPSKNVDFTYPGECKKIQKKMIHGKFSQDKWNHIFVKKNEKTISVNLQNGTTLLEWTDVDDEINVSQSIITLRTLGQFKVHEYNLIFTNEQSVKQMGNFDFKAGYTFCIAIFVKMCKKCKMILFLENPNGEKSKEETFTTIIEICSKPPEKSNGMERCLDYSLKIGDICYPFNTISNVGSRICYFHKQQKQSMCYCSPGYSGQYCNTGCQSSYGYDCEEKCGHCTHNTCNKINGNCFHGCESNFAGTTCKIGKYPVLKQLPKILKVDSFSIKLTLDSTGYEGQEKPVGYKFLYRRKSTDYSALWSETVHFKWNDFSEKYIENLTPSTVYEIKALLIANNGKFDGENTPIFEVITDCYDLTRNSVIIISLTNVSVKLFVDITEQSCHLSSYEITMGREIVSFSNNIYSRRDLEPNRKYEIIFRRNSTTFTFDFQTEGRSDHSLHYYVWPVLLLILMVLVAGLLLYRRKIKRNQSTTKKGLLDIPLEPVLPGRREIDSFAVPIVPGVQDENIYEVPNDPNEQGEYLSPEDIEHQYELVINFLEKNIVAENAERTYISVLDVDYKYDYVVDLLEKVTDPVYANLQNNLDDSTQVDNETSRLRTCLSEIKDRLVQMRKDLRSTGSAEKIKRNADMLEKYLRKELKEIYERIQDLNTTIDSNK